MAFSISAPSARASTSVREISNERGLLKSVKNPDPPRIAILGAGKGVDSLHKPPARQTIKKGARPPPYAQPRKEPHRLLSVSLLLPQLGQRSLLLPMWPITRLLFRWGGTLLT